MALGAHKPDDAIPVNYDLVDRDVDALYKAGQGKVGTDHVSETTERAITNSDSESFLLLNRCHFVKF